LGVLLLNDGIDGGHRSEFTIGNAPIGEKKSGVTSWSTLPANHRDGDKKDERNGLRKSQRSIPTLSEKTSSHRETVALDRSSQRMKDGLEEEAARKSCGGSLSADLKITHCIRNASGKGERKKTAGREGRTKVKSSKKQR